MSESITITTPTGLFNAYVVRPVEEPSPAVVLLHELFGINADMRERCRELAQQGYTAVCPDLFWRLEPGVDLSDQNDADWKKGLNLYARFDLEAGISDIAATLAVAASLPTGTGKVGITGYCLGGLMTFLAAARLGTDAAAVYYPGGAENHLAEARTLAGPMLVHLAAEDEYMSKDAQAKITSALQEHDDVQVHVYAGCSHAFARHGGIHFDQSAATLANGRTSAFLATYLRP